MQLHHTQGTFRRGELQSAFPTQLANSIRVGDIIKMTKADIAPIGSDCGHQLLQMYPGVPIQSKTPLHDTIVSDSQELFPNLSTRQMTAAMRKLFPGQKYTAHSIKRGATTLCRQSATTNALKNSLLRHNLVDLVARTAAAPIFFFLTTPHARIKMLGGRV